MKAYCFYCFMRREAFADEEMDGGGVCLDVRHKNSVKAAK